MTDIKPTLFYLKLVEAIVSVYSTDAPSIRKIVGFTLPFLRQSTNTSEKLLFIKSFLICRVASLIRELYMCDRIRKFVAESIFSFSPGFHAFKLPPLAVNEEALKNINRNRSQMNPEFLSGIEQFKKLLRTTLVANHSFNDGEIVTGEGE